MCSLQIWCHDSEANRVTVVHINKNQEYIVLNCLLYTFPTIILTHLVALETDGNEAATHFTWRGWRGSWNRKPIRLISSNWSDSPLLLLSREAASCSHLQESWSAIRQAGRVKEFRWRVGPTGLSVYQHAEANGSIHPAEGRCSTQEGRNRLVKDRLGSFKAPSFTLRASNYTTAEFVMCWCDERLLFLELSPVSRSISVSSSLSLCLRSHIRPQHLQAVLNIFLERLDLSSRGAGL